MKTKTFPTERVHGSQIFPFPKNEQTAEENPPCLSWHPFEEKVTYKVKILKDKTVIWEGETENNYISPDCFLDAGKYEKIVVGMEYNELLLSETSQLFFTTTVNTGLSADKVIYGKADMNERVIELVREKQEGDRRLLASEWVIAALSLVILFVPIAIAMLVPMEEWVRTAVAFSGFIPAIVGLLLALRIEQRAGYYECAECKHRYIPKYLAVYLAPHISRTRYMRCPACNKRSWQKKVISREKEE